MINIFLLLVLTMRILHARVQLGLLLWSTQVGEGWQVDELGSNSVLLLYHCQINYLIAFWTSLLLFK